MSQPPPIPTLDDQEKSQWITLLLSLTLLAFLGSGVLSFLSDSILWLFQRQDLAIPAGLISFLMLLFGFLIYGIMALVPRVPKRFFLPLSLYLPVAAAAVLPLLIYFTEHTRPIVCAVSLGQIILSLILIYKAQGGLRPRWPIFPESRLTARNFRWGNLVVMLLAAFLVIIPALLLYTAFSAKLALSHFSDDFVKIGPKGISMQIRNYTRDDDKKITLIPMSHVGEIEFYNELSSSFPDDSVVLMEGVSDIENTITTHSNYSKMADAIGGVEQVKAFKPRGEIVAADVDISTFSPTTQELLKTAMMLHAKGVTAETLPILMKPTPPGLEKALIADILTKRNHHLLGVLRERLPTSNHIIVPWGAAHMPEIAREILKLGFRQTDTRDLVAIRFGS